MFGLRNIFRGKKFVILSIDGGGVRGIIPLTFLSLLQEEFGVNLVEHCDLIAGTSVGAIVSSCIAFGIPYRKCEEIMLDKVKEIFKERRSSLKGLTKSKYSNEVLYAELHKVLGDTTFGEIDKKLILTATSITKGVPKLFTYLDREVRVIDAVMASGAAPIYFDPWKIGKENFVDGGLWANNPSMVALMHSRKHFKVNFKNIAFISLGVGRSNATPNNPKKSSWGAISWNIELVKLALSSIQSSTESSVATFLRKESYLRVNPTLHKEVFIDDISQMEYLRSEAAAHFKKNRKQIERFVRDYLC